MTDRADEIAEKAGDYFETQDQVDRQAAAIRAYALEFAKDQYKQGRNAALKDSMVEIMEADCEAKVTGADVAELAVAKVRALKEEA